MYKFAILDPRAVPEAKEKNDSIFANQVYGIEVTVPALAKRCIFNLDPQHSEGDANCAAIEVAVEAVLPPDGCTLATVKADLDSIGAMAIFELRWSHWFGALPDEHIYHCPRCSWDHEGPCSDIQKRINLVAESDKFARGGWPGLKPLPNKNEDWMNNDRPLATLGAAVSDFKVPLEQRVKNMQDWLLEGKLPEQYLKQVDKERLDLISALEKGDIKSETRAKGLIAVVKSTHRAATSVGYSLAPVVVALNPNFKQGDGESYRKFTICTFEPKFADIKSALAELSLLEEGWGGSPNIGGSPQKVSSQLAIDEVVAIVERHLR